MSNQFQKNINITYTQFVERIPVVNRLPVVQQLAVLAAMLLLIFSGVITPRILAFVRKTNVPAAVPLSQVQATTTQQEAATSSNPFSDVTITAKAAYVWDVKDQRALYKKNESEQLPLASVTKLMTALIAHEVLDEKQPVTIGAQAISQDGDSGLKKGETFSRLALSDFSLISSSNDGAFALAVAAGNKLIPNSGATGFVGAMNIRAQQLGLTQTYYKNPTGLDISTTQAGAFGSARDMAFLMEYILKNDPDILSYTIDDQARVYDSSGAYHDAENTNYYVNSIPGLIGSKTGYTDLAGGNLVVAFNVGLNHPVIAVVLGSTYQDRFTDILKLVKDTQAYTSMNIEQK